MRVSAKITAQFEDEGRLKATATVCLGGEFLITGVRVVAVEKGPAVFMPSRQLKTGEYRDICFPITPELYRQIKETVLSAYDRAAHEAEETPPPMPELETGQEPKAGRLPETEPPG